MGDRLSTRLRDLPTHRTGCQVGQVVSLLHGLWHYGSHSELLTTAIRHVTWVNGPYLITGVFFGHSSLLPQLNIMKNIKIIMGILVGQNWFRSGLA